MLCRLGIHNYYSDSDLAYSARRCQYCNKLQKNSIEYTLDPFIYIQMKDKYDPEALSSRIFDEYFAAYGKPKRTILTKYYQTKLGLGLMT